MAKFPLPSPAYVRQLLLLDADGRGFTWLPRSPEDFLLSRRKTQHKNFNSQFANTPALTAVDANGYRHGWLQGHRVKAHRVMWAYVHGEWPDGILDHINGDPADNRIDNLRVVTHSENSRNVKMYSSNTSGEMGVFWDKDTGKYIARIGGINLGRYETIAEAKAARHAGTRILAYHENHGRTTNIRPRKNLRKKL